MTDDWPISSPNLMQVVPLTLRTNLYKFAPKNGLQNCAVTKMDCISQVQQRSASKLYQSWVLG